MRHLLPAVAFCVLICGGCGPKYVPIEFHVSKHGTPVADAELLLSYPAMFVLRLEDAVSGQTNGEGKAVMTVAEDLIVSGRRAVVLRVWPQGREGVSHGFAFPSRVRQGWERVNLIYIGGSDGVPYNVSARRVESTSE